MRYRATLVGALVKPFEPFGGKGVPGPWACLENSKEACVKQAHNVLAKLTDAERKEAYVRIVEIQEKTIMEIHTAAEKGPDGELRFAVAEV